MGCGGSKHESESSDIVPVKLRPLLRHRFEDLRWRTTRHHHSLNDTTTLSKKELLHCVEDASSNSRRSLHDDLDQTSDSSLDDHNHLKVAPAPTQHLVQYDQTLNGGASVKSDSDHKVISNYDQEKKREEAGKGIDEGKKEEANVVAEAVTEAEAKTLEKDGSEGEETEEDEDDGRLSRICPGSPSFRIYFQESLDNTKDDDDDDYHEKDHDDTEEKTESEDVSETIESVSSNEVSSESTVVIKKKGKRGSRFKKVLPKKRHLLSVKSCYHPSCGCSGHDKGRLLAQKQLLEEEF